MNEQAEEILLGSILKENSILQEITLSPDHFLDLTNRNIYKAMLKVKKKGFPIDGASLKDELGEAGFLFIGGNERLQAYAEIVPSIHAFKSYEQFVINQWKISTSRDLLTSAVEAEINIENLQTLIRDLSKVDEEGTQDDFNLKEHLANMYDLISTPVPLKRSGISSGYRELDNKTDGFQPNDLIIIGARPSMGKTAFLLNLAKNAGRANAIPVIFSLEMSTESLIRRMISCIAQINGMKLKNPYNYTNDDEKARWIKALGVLEKLNLKIYDKPRQTVAEMKAKVRKAKYENPDKDIIIFIDYLTLIKASQDYKGSTHAQITEISADLKAMAKDFKCPIICLAQLNRGVENRENKRPAMSDLRESGSIEQDADVIMMLYRDEYYNPETEDKNVLEIDVKKNRDGEVGPIRLKYLKEINRIESFK